MTTIERLQVEYEAKTSRAERDARRFAATQEEVAARTREAEGSFVSADGRLRDLRGRYVAAGKGAEEAERKTGRLSKAMHGLTGRSRDLSTMLGAIAFPGAIGGLGALMAAAQSTGGALVALGAAAAPLAGLGATIPQLAGAAVQGFAVAKLATAGFGDALKALDSGDVEKITKAMKDMSPEARKAVRSVYALKPAFDDIRRVAQERVFAGFNTGLRQLRSFIPQVREAVAGTATVLGDFISRISTMAAGRWRGDINTFLATNTRLLGMGATAGLHIADAFVNLTAAAQPLALWLGRLAAEGGESAAAFIANARATGGLRRFFEATQRAALELGSIIWSLVSILAGLGKAAFASGQTMLGSISDVLEKWASWVNSAKGQAELNRFFDESRVILGFVAQVVGDLALKGAMAAGALQRVAAAAAGLAQQHPGLAKVAAAAAGIGGALALLAKVGAVGKVTAAFTALSSVVPGLGPIVLVLAAIGAAAFIAYQKFEPFRALVDQVWQVITRNALPAFQSFIGFIQSKVVPVLGPALTQAISQITRTLSGLVSAFRNNQAQFLAFGRVVLEVGKWLLVTLLPAVIKVGGWFAGQLIKQVTGAINIFAWLVRGIQAIVGVVQTVAGFVPKAWNAITNAFTTGVNAVVGFFQALPGRVMGAIAALPGLLVALAGNALRLFLEGVKRGAMLVIAFVVGVPLLIIGAMIALPALLVALARKAWQWFQDEGIRKINAFLTWAHGLPGRTWSAMLALVERLGTLATNAWNAFVLFSRRKWDGFYAWATTLPGKAWAALKAMPGKLADTATSAWQAFWNKGKEWWAKVLNWFRSLPGGAARAFGGFTNAIARVIASGLNKASGFFNTFMNKIEAIGAKLGVKLNLPRMPGFTVGGDPADRRQSVPGGRGGLAAGGPVDDAAGGGRRRRSAGASARLARGGTVPLRSGARRGLDSVHVLATPGEYMLTPEMVGAFPGGLRGLEQWRAMSNASMTARRRMGRNATMPPAYASGGPVAMAGGGIIDKLGSILDPTKALRAIANPILNRLSGIGGVTGQIARGGANKVLDAALAKLREVFSAGGLGGGIVAGQVGSMMRVLRAAFPGLALISGFRPGAVTHATGRQSYHALGRAVDVPPSMAVFNWIRSHFGRNTRELIFSPAGNRQIHNGAPHMYTGVTRADHWNHVHWAMAKGGLVGMAAAGAVPTPGVVGQSTNMSGLAAFTGRRRGAMLPGGGASFEQYQQVLGAYAMRKAAAARPVRGWQQRAWHWAPLVANRNEFYTNDLRDANRGKAGFIQTGYGWWKRASAAELRQRLHTSATAFGIGTWGRPSSRKPAPHRASPRKPAPRRPSQFANLPNVVRDGTVSEATWNRLLAAGWRGRPGDRMEALYRPSQFANLPNVVRDGTVSSATWNALLAAGWRGNPRDHMEALHRPGYAAGGLVGAGARGYGGTGYVPSMSSSSSTSSTSNVTMAPGMVNLSFHGTSGEVIEQVRREVGAALGQLVESIYARGG